MTTSDNVVIETEISQELRPEYVEVLKAFLLLSSQGLFPMRGSGNITIHYNEKGTIVKIIPSPHIKI